jgi:hypothetical protein
MLGAAEEGTCPLTTSCSCLITPYPFGQIKHLAYKVEGNPRGLLYNYQVVGKHPVTGFSSLSLETAHPPRPQVYPQS